MAKQKKTFIPKDPEKFAYAERLYIEGIAQEVIAERVGVSKQTISNWKSKGQWDSKRAALMLSPKTMMTKLMNRLNEMIDSREGFDADAFSKVAKQLRDLQKDSNVDDVINVLIDFGRWLENEAINDKEIDEKFIQKVTILHDRFIEEQFAKYGQN